MAGRKASHDKINPYLENDPRKKGDQQEASQKEDVSKQILQFAKTFSFGQVKAWLQHNQNIDLTVTDASGKTVLHHVAAAGEVDIIKLLLEKNAPINQVSKEGLGAIHCAASRGQTNAIETLLDNRALVGHQALNGRTPLHFTAEKNHLQSTILLLDRGADILIKDFDGNSALDFCENKTHRSVLAKAYAEQMAIKLGQIEVDTAILKGKAIGKFRHFDILIVCSDLEDSPDVEIEVHCQKKPKETMQIEFMGGSLDELCGDVHTFKVKGCPEAKVSLNSTLTLPLSFGPSKTEVMVIKTDRGEDVPVTNIKRQGNKYTGDVKIDLLKMTSFVLISRPRKERFKVDKEATTFKSSTDQRVEMEVQQNTFKKTVTLSISMTEQPVIEAAIAPNIMSLTPFYSIETEGEQPDNDVTFKIPMPEEAIKKDKNFYLMTMNLDEDQETPEAWEFLYDRSEVKGDRMLLTLSSFSQKVMVMPRDFIVGTQTDEVELKRQVSATFRKARRRTHSVSFICLTKREPGKDSYKLIVDCCFTTHLEDRRSHWLTERFEPQRHQDVTILTQAKEIFAIRLGDMVGIQASPSEQSLEFHPRRERNVIIFGLQVSPKREIGTGVLKLEKLPKSTSTNFTSADQVEKVLLTMPLQLHGSKRTQPKKQEDPVAGLSTGSEFLNDLQVTEIVTNFESDSWHRVCILMGIPWAEVESMLRPGQNTPIQDITQLVVSWRKQYSNEAHRGIPILLSAMMKGGHAYLAKTIQLRLSEWYKSKRSEQHKAFRAWVTKAYRNTDLMIPGDYPRPMSEQFMLLLSEEVTWSLDLGRKLELTDGFLNEVDGSKVYQSDGLKAMKIFIEFRNNSPSNHEALKRLVRVLEDLGKKFNSPRKCAVSWVSSWLKQNADKKDGFYEKVAAVVH